jgi:hypothetical protein
LFPAVAILIAIIVIILIVGAAQGWFKGSGNNAAKTN